MKKKYTFFLLLFIFSVLKTEAGDSLKVFRRTGIYTLIGGGDYIHANLNAEHYFVNSKIFHLGLRGAYGTWVSWGMHGNDASLTLSGLTGKQYHFFELQAGSLLLIDQSEKAKESNNNQPTQNYYFMISPGYNLRWRHLLLKATIEIVPGHHIATMNTGLGVIF